MGLDVGRVVNVDFYFLAVQLREKECGRSETGSASYRLSSALLTSSSGESSNVVCLKTTSRVLTQLPRTKEKPWCEVGERTKEEEVGFVPIQINGPWSASWFLSWLCRVKIQNLFPPLAFPSETFGFTMIKSPPHKLTGFEVSSRFDREGFGLCRCHVIE